VAVIAIDDARWQERPLAIVCLKSGGNPNEAIVALRAFLLDKVAKFWIPEYWSVVKDIPKTSVGKIDKKRLRTLLSAESLAVKKETGSGGDNG